MLRQEDTTDQVHSQIFLLSHSHQDSRFCELRLSTDRSSITSCQRTLIMNLCISVISLICVASQGLAAPSVEEYLNTRIQTIDTEQSVMLGASTVLTDAREIAVNDIIMKFKQREYKEGLDSNGNFFASSKHIYHSKEQIEESNVFKIIRILPKGAALHMHDTTVGPLDFVVANLSRWDNLYYCKDNGDHLLFRFFPMEPGNGCSPTSSWVSVSKLRDEASSDDWVDNYFLKSLTMQTPVPENDYPNTNVAWGLFEKRITTVSGIANYEPALREYYTNILRAHKEDNVMYIEMRGLLSDVYYLNQTELSSLDTLRVYKETTDRFVAANPDFFGGKFIFAPHRFHPAADIGKMIDDAVVMKQTFPDYFAGFDLVGQEDKGTPLLGFLPQLLSAVDKNIKFFFHSGETDWRGTKIDENLIDAVLLNTTRIGHGYALSSHPVLMDRVKTQGIAIEVCPISNQILRLVEDFRNHPGATYLRDGFPVVIAADGPGIFETYPLSHDWYIAFMALAGERADLRLLKQLALNSIEYSAMSTQEKTSALARWEQKWSVFLDQVLSMYSRSKNN